MRYCFVCQGCSEKIIRGPDGKPLCTYQLLAPTIPLGKGRDLAMIMINYPTLWAGEAIKSLPITLPHYRGLCEDLII